MSKAAGPFVMARKGVESVLPVNGTSFIDNFDDLIEDLHSGDYLTLVKDTGNEYDPNAISVRLTDCKSHLGYIPKEHAVHAPDELTDYIVRVEHVFHREPGRHPGIRIRLSYEEDLFTKTIDEYLNVVRGILDELEAIQFLDLTYDLVGVPESDSPYEMASLTRVGNAVRRLNNSGVDVEALVKMIISDDDEDLVVEDLEEMGLVPDGVTIRNIGFFHEVIGAYWARSEASLASKVLLHAYRIALGEIKNDTQP